MNNGQTTWGQVTLGCIVIVLSLLAVAVLILGVVAALKFLIGYLVS